MDRIKFLIEIYKKKTTEVNKKAKTNYIVKKNYKETAQVNQNNKSNYGVEKNQKTKKNIIKKI